MRSNIKENKVKILLKILIVIIIITIPNCVIVRAANDTVVSDKNWSEWQERDYWEWHTRTTTNDKSYNGEHIGIENDTISFYGYGQTSYKDFLYKEYTNPGKKIFKLILDESKANYHSLDGSGFIFNASKTDNKLSGYVLLFKEKTVCLYRLDDVDINTFEKSSNKTVDMYGKLLETIDKSNSTIRDLVIEASPKNINVTEGGTEILNVDLDYSIHEGESFGLISSYAEHDCNILSIIEFYEFKITLEDYKISVLNTNLSNEPIQGGYFELKNENGEIVKEGEANSNGIFSVEGVKEGIYTIQQKSQPEGYALNDTIYKFKLTNEGKIVDINTGEEINLVVKNEKIEEETINKNPNTNEKENSNKLNDEKDNTKSSIPLPNTGEKGWVFFIAIGLVVIFGVYIAIKLKEYKIVK